MIITLERFAYFEDCTRGKLTIASDEFQTVERPWIKNPLGPGGVPRESCIPDGSYRLRDWVRPSGANVFIFSNPDLGVWEQEADSEGVAWGRFLALMHVGNTVEDVVGCIAPGMSGGVHHVSKSRIAMDRILELLQGSEHELVIVPKRAR